MGVGGLGVGGLGDRGLGVEWVSSRHRGLSRAMALHVAKSVGRSLRFSAFLSVKRRKNKKQGMQRPSTNKKKPTARSLEPEQTRENQVSPSS